MLIIGCLVGGFIIEHSFPTLAAVMSGYAHPLILTLMVIVGMQMGSDLSWIREWRKYGALALLICVTTVIGSLSAAWIYTLLDTALRPRDAMLVASGMSFYSLSSILIGQEGLKTLSVLSLISNLVREAIALASVPFLVRIFGKLAPIAAVASGSDSGAPVITRASGREYTVLCCICAFILSLLVPVLTKALLLMG
jgi:uncharacterized membrane protein YbjE (DUF340 family)